MRRVLNLVSRVCGNEERGIDQEPRERGLPWGLVERQRERETKRLTERRSSVSFFRQTSAHGTAYGVPTPITSRYAAGSRAHASTLTGQVPYSSISSPRERSWSALWSAASFPWIAFSSGFEVPPRRGDKGGGLITDGGWAHDSDAVDAAPFRAGVARRQPREGSAAGVMVERDSACKVDVIKLPGSSGVHPPEGETVVVSWVSIRAARNPPPEEGTVFTNCCGAAAAGSAWIVPHRGRVVRARFFQIATRRRTAISVGTEGATLATACGMTMRTSLSCVANSWALISSNMLLNNVPHSGLATRTGGKSSSRGRSCCCVHLINVIRRDGFPR